MIDLARASRGWSKAQLAKVLERDPTKLYPESGNPKADFLIKLAEVLEWPVADLIETVWGPQLPGAAAAVGAEKSEPKPAVGAGSYEELFGQARSAHQKGDYRQVVSLSRLMYSVASNEDHKAVACSVEASGWDGLGRYVQEVEACKRGLQHRPENPIRRNQLRAVLANAWYSLWELTPALGTAELLANWYEKNPPKTDLDWKRPAFVHYVRGHTHRRMAFTEPELRQEHLLAAEADLKQSAEMHESLSIKLNAPQLAGIANTCRGGLLEIDVELGRRNAADTINEIVAKVDAADIGQATGDWLESHGWWCIFGSDLAVRHLKGRELQETTRHLTSKAASARRCRPIWRSTATPASRACRQCTRNGRSSPPCSPTWTWCLPRATSPSPAATPIW